MLQSSLSSVISKAHERDLRMYVLAPGNVPHRGAGHSMKYSKAPYACALKPLLAQTHISYDE